MAGRAVCLPQMFRVVKNDVKAFQSGKRFYCRRFCIRMTNRADRAFIIGELRRVTARARQMTGKFGCRRIVLALVAKRARKTRVFGICMTK